MVPLDRYSVFPRAIDALYKETRLPFKLIVVEGNASENMRYEIEKRKQKYKNIQIVYTDHHPRLAEAFNLGLVHIRTKHAFLMHNGLVVTPGWLENLMEQAKAREGVLCPYVSNAQDPPSFVHALLVTKELLNDIGLFDESIGTALMGMDLINRLKAKGIPVHRDPYTVLECPVDAAPKNGDRQFFAHQWDDPHARQTLAYLKQKWGVAPDEIKYLEWLEKRGLIPAPFPKAHS